VDAHASVEIEANAALPADSPALAAVAAPTAVEVDAEALSGGAAAAAAGVVSESPPFAPRGGYSACGPAEQPLTILLPLDDQHGAEPGHTLMIPMQLALPEVAQLLARPLSGPPSDSQAGALREEMCRAALLGQVRVQSGPTGPRVCYSGEPDGTSLSAPRVVLPERARGPPRRRGGYRNYVDEGGGAEVLAAERWARCAESGRESRSRWDAATAAASAEASTICEALGMDSSGHLCLGLAPASVASADLAASSVATASPASAHPFAALGGSPSAAFTPEDAAAAAAGSKRQRLLPRRATGDEEEADADGEPQTPPPSSGNFAFALQPSCWQERVVGWRVQAAQYTTGRLISGEVVDWRADSLTPFVIRFANGSLERAALPHAAVELVDERGEVVSWEEFLALGDADPTEFVPAGADADAFTDIESYTT